jgi:hypothetical protein
VKRLDYLTAPTKRAKEAGRNIGKIKVRQWVTNDMSFWALLEQIRNAKNLKGVNDTLFYCVYNVGKDLGLETG